MHLERQGERTKCFHFSVGNTIFKNYKISVSKDLSCSLGLQCKTLSLVSAAEVVTGVCLLAKAPQDGAVRRPPVGMLAHRVFPRLQHHLHGT